MSLSTHDEPRPARVADTRQRLADGPFALLSVLLELTVAALELSDPKHSPDAFLDHLLERLGCYAALLFENDATGSVSLQSAAGLAESSRLLPLPREATMALGDQAVNFRLPYPELERTPLYRWHFPIAIPHHADRSWVLSLFFDREPYFANQLRGMIGRLVAVLRTVLLQRSLFSQSIESARRLDQQKSLLESISEESVDGILVVGTDGNVLFYNRRFVEMWDIEKEIASCAWATVRDALASRVDDPIAFLDRAQRLGEHEAMLHQTIRLRDGRVFECYGAPVKNRSGVLYGWGTYYRDVTERVRYEAERERLLATEQASRTQAEEAIRARDDFLSVASHEMRTPITSMQLVVQSALRAYASESTPDSERSRVRQSLETVQRQTMRLRKLIDALLDVSRIHAGRLALEVEPVDLVEVTREVLARFAEEIGRSGSTVSVHAPGAVIGNWDRSRIDQVVTNLISNALKYGCSKPIDVTIEIRDQLARLAVRDRGLGISEQFAAQLFHKFERATSSRHYAGLGLGLYIVRQIVEMHRGSVRVESTLGSGSTFIVELPVRGPDRPVEPPVPEPANPPS